MASPVYTGIDLVGRSKVWCLPEKLDGSGNPTTYEGQPIGYDVENRLTSYASNFTAGYGVNGLRAWKTENGVTTYYLYALGSTIPLFEINAAGATTAINTVGADGLVSRKASTNNTFYQFDPQGTVADRTNTAGVVTSASISDAFGEVSNSSAITDPFGYDAQDGYYTDQSTGFILAGFRYYDPGAGRFLTRDPTGYEGGINVYGYTGNNPETGRDPFGLDDEEEENDLGEGILLAELLDAIEGTEATAAEAEAAGATSEPTAANPPAAENECPAESEGPKAGKGPQGPLYRYIGPGELEPVITKGILRGGKPGTTRWTPDEYDDSTSAMQLLSLPRLPMYRLTFTLPDMPQDVTGPGPVGPRFGQPGGGIELSTEQPVPINLTGVWVLKFKP